MFSVLLVLNVFWFGIAFVSFGLMPRRSAKLIAPRETRDSPLFEVLAGSIRFLGGMNLALAVFALVLLLAASRFPEPLQQSIFFGVFAVAHASQFAVNMPIALTERTRSPLWPVLRGPMLFIFIVDGSLMLANAIACVARQNLI